MKYFLVFLTLILASCINPVIDPPKQVDPLGTATPAPVYTPIPGVTGQPTPAPMITPAPTATPITVPAPSGLNGPVKAVFFDGSAVKFWDGVNFVTWESGAAIRASGKAMVIAIGSTLYTIDQSGLAVANALIPATSNAIALQPKNVASRSIDSITAGNNVWTFAPVTTEEQNAAGNYTSYWTHIYKNGVEQLPWFQFGVLEAFVAANGDVIVKDDAVKNFHDLTTPRKYIMAASDGGPIMWQNNAIDPDFYMSDAAGDHKYPCGAYFNANQPHTWFTHGGIWYSTNGMKWVPGGTFENRGAAIVDFSTHNSLPKFLEATNNFSATYLQYAGEYNNLIYLIDPCIGWLIAFDAESNLYAPVTQLFMGNNNDNSDGYLLAPKIKPQIIDGAIYWHRNNVIWKTDINTLSTVNFAPEQQIWVMP